MKPETRFNHWLGGVWPPGHFCRVEPPPTPGIPDINYCVEGVEGWIELKVLYRGRFPYAKRFLRASQRRWMRQRLVVHGRVFVLAKDGDWLVAWTAQNALEIKRTTTRDEGIALAILRVRARAGLQLTEQLRILLTSS